MATASNPQTATIYQFPVKARMPYRTASPVSDRSPRIEFGSWYHDAAIAEDRSQHKRDGH